MWKLCLKTYHLLKLLSELLLCTYGVFRQRTISKRNLKTRLAIFCLPSYFLTLIDNEKMKHGTSGQTKAEKARTYSQSLAVTLVKS